MPLKNVVMIHDSTTLCLLYHYVSYTVPILKRLRTAKNKQNSFFGQDVFHMYGFDCTKTSIKIFFLKIMTSLMSHWFGGRPPLNNIVIQRSKNDHNCWYWVKVKFEMSDIYSKISFQKLSRPTKKKSSHLISGSGLQSLLLGLLGLRSVLVHQLKQLGS